MGQIEEAVTNLLFCFCAKANKCAQKIVRNDKNMKIF